MSNESQWEQDKAWADGYLPQIEAVVRQVAGDIIEIRTGTDEEDRKQATDYVVHVSSGAIACRVRQNCSYRDLTLRASRPSGTETELAKIKAGWGRWYLYMWTKGGQAAAWIFVDMDSLRASGLLDGAARQRNPDGVTFLPISVQALATAGCLVQSQGVLEVAAHA